MNPDWRSLQFREFKTSLSGPGVIEGGRLRRQPTLLEPTRGQLFSGTWSFKSGKQGHPHVFHHAHARSLPCPKPNQAGNLPATGGSAWRPGTNESEEKRERRKMHESQIFVERGAQEREKDEDGANDCGRLDTTCSSRWLCVDQPLSLAVASLLPVPSQTNVCSRWLFYTEQLL